MGAAKEICWCRTCCAPGFVIQGAGGARVSNVRDPRVSEPREEEPKTEEPRAEPPKAAEPPKGVEENPAVVLSRWSARAGPARSGRFFMLGGVQRRLCVPQVRKGENMCSLLAFFCIFLMNVRARLCAKLWADVED